MIWAAVPLANALYFFLVPIRTLAEEEEGLSIRRLSGKMVFWILMVLMICAGASEQAVSQWASAFAESGLHVSKSVGDLAGPCAFAFFMGVSRVVSAKYSDRISLERDHAGSGGLCVVSYLLIALSPWPVLSLAGCALCGFAVGGRCGPHLQPGHEKRFRAEEPPCLHCLHWRVISGVPEGLLW